MENKSQSASSGNICNSINEQRNCNADLHLVKLVYVSIAVLVMLGIEMQATKNCSGRPLEVGHICFDPGSPRSVTDR